MSNNCQIKRNSQGKIVEVAGNNPTFKNILNNTPTLSLEEAIEVYKHAFKFQILGERGAMSLDQAEEVTFRMDNLLIAKDMEKAGKTPLEIRLATGWERGADSLWRYEIEEVVVKDVEVELNKEYSFLDIVEADTLKKAYPQIKDLKIIINDKNRTLFDRVGNKIEISSKYITNSLFPSSKSATNIEEMFGARLFRLRQGSNRVLSHEATHYVQLQEGFHRGGSTAALFTEADILSGVEETDSDAVRFDKYTKLIERKEDYTGSNRKIIDALERFYKGDGSVPTEVYKRLAGEVEARNVEYRLNMTPEQRRQKLLEETEEVAREDQIFLRDGMGEAMYTPPAKEIEEQLINTLKKNGLSTNVVLLNTNEINKKLQELGVDAETRKQITAWHGSPYSFDRFEFSDRTFLSAEGNAAFGAGLYFTDLESIAINYANTLAKVTVKGDTKGYNSSDIKDALSIVKLSGSKQKSIENLKKTVEETEKILQENPNKIFEKKRLEATNKLIEILKNLDIVVDRNLYKVSLHQGKTPDQYTWLEWDKEVPDSIYNSVGKKLKSNGKFLNELFQDSMEFEKTDGSKVKGNKPDGLLFYKRISQILGGDKEASIWLLSQGIDGIKYPAESISRGATSDTARGFNYVVFDENAITIEERIQFQKQLAENGIALTTKGFVDLKTKEIYLNKDLATNETLLHEYTHLFNSYTKQNHPELYKRGIALVKEQTEKENSEIKEIIEYIKTTQPSLEGEALYEEILTEFTARTTDEMLEKSGGIFEWLKNFWENLKGLLGLTQMSVEEVYKLDLKSYAEAVGRDLLRGEDLVQEYFTRQADRLPLTLSIFQRPEFVDMQGKMVNKQTILNYLNQTGIKQIEKDIVKDTINNNFPQNTKVSYDEVEASVRANIMPLERLYTSSYADYGMDNLGDGRYGEAKTIILNAPIEHGVTGHFSGDFKASARKDIKYVAKQLNDNVWVAVEEGAQLNSNNIYNFVGTAGTKESVDAWIIKYNLSQGVIYDNKEYLVYQDAFDRYDNVLPVAGFDTEQEAKDFIEKNRDKYTYNLDYVDKQYIVDNWNWQDINKGMFAHIRVWQDGEVFTVAELQSDYFQNNNAKKFFANESAILKSKEYQKKIEEVTEKRSEEFKKAIVVKQNEAKTQWRIWLGEQSYGVYETKEEAEKDIEGGAKFLLSFALEEQNIKKDKDVIKYFNNELDKLYQKLSPQEKQFIASQKEWEKRMVREAIKEASLSGATSLRFPTPYTLSVIEGYLSEGAPYEIENANDSTYLEAGDRIYYAGEDYTLLDSDSTTITIAESGRVQSAEEQDIIDNEIENAVDNDMYEIENNLKDFYTEEEWNDFRDNYSSISSTELSDVANEVEEGVFEVSEGKIRDIVTKYYQEIFTDANSILSDLGVSDIYQSGTTFYYTDGTANIETLMQPSEYKGQGTKDSFSIEDDLDDTQQTVARKYEEIAEILKKERGEDNFEIVTDENGFDWYETELTQEDVTASVVAFQQAKLEFKTNDGQTFLTYKEALQNSKDNEFIDVILNNEKVASLTATTANNSFEGVVNDLIKSNILSGERTLDTDGNIYYKPQGNSEVLKTINASIADTHLRTFIGHSNYKWMSDNTLRIEKPQEGQKAPKIMEMAAQLYNDLTAPFGDKRVLMEAVEITPQNELEKALLSLLEAMGVSTSVVEKFNDLPVNALADIANRIVAFKNGEISTELLSEETAHFIVEALPQAEIENLLRNVDKTPQWEQYSEQYMEKYGDENLVRREVLGKILKDAFVNKFNAENKPEIEQRFYNKLLQLFTDFINRVRAYFTPQNEQQLADFTEKVYRNLLAGDLINQMDLNQLEGNKIALFNAGNDLSTKEGLLYANARKTVELLTAQDRKLSTSSSATRKQLGDIEVEIDKAVEKQLEQIGAELENASKITAIAGIAQIARKQVKHLNQAIEKNRPFSSEENVVYLNVIGKLNRYIAALSELLNPTVKAEKTLIDSLNEITLDIQKMASRKETAQNDLWEQEIQRLRVKNDMTDEEVAELRGALKAIQQDTTWLFSYLGSMTHAQNPLLNMAANRISRMTTETNSNFVRRSKAFYNTLEAIGFDVRKSKMFKDEGGYLLDIIDHNKYETDLYTYKTSLYNKMTNSDLSIPEFKKLEYNNGLKFENNEQKREYDEDWAAWQKENQYIDVLTKEARQEKENRLKNLSEKTRRFITRLSKESGAITRKARENDNEFTQYMYEELQELARQRKVAKSPFSVNGKLKQGLKFDENGELALDGNPLSEEATLSWELTQYDKQTEFKEKGIPQAFKDKLASFSNPMDAYEFLKYNATISFNNSFWETMKQGDNFVSKLRKAGLDSDADAIEKAQKFRTQILRKYANKNNPSEIDYSEMSATDIEDVKVKTEWLETEYARLKGKIKEENTDVDVAFSAVPNNAFFSELIDRLGSVRETPEHFNFILEHVSSKSRLNLEKARIMLEEVLAEEKEEIPEKWRELFTTPTDKEDAYSQLIAYGQTKLLPYFKRIEPKGGMYSETMRQLETNTITPMDFVNKIESGELPFISLSPSFIFETVEDDKNINPEWLENERLGRPQIDLKKYRNARYDKMFNPDANGNPTTNVVEWRALQEFVKFHEETLKSAGKSGSHNKFLLPQKGMRGWRQVENLVRNTNKESIQEMFRDFAMFREDTTELGQNADGTFNHAMKDTELIIPRYGFRRLENQDDLTDELFASYNWMAYNAEAYKARVNAFADMEAIKEQILNADLGGKDVLSSNMYKMFDSFIRHAIYGQQESFSYETDLFGILPRKYNLAPLAKKLQEWVRLVNLGFSFLVPVTSILQGSVNYQIEKSVGERIDKDASRLARRQLGRMLGRSVADSLKISAKSELNSMLEFFGVYNVATRYENSNYNRTVRGLSKASFLTHTLADAPIKGQVGLTVLHDFRVVNGSIINFNTFKRQGNYSSEKDARHEWAKYEDKALFNYLIVENGITSYNKEKLAEELPNVENLDEFLLDKTQRVKDAMEIANSDIDSIIPEDQKSVVQRHAIFSFFMMHRGWLVTAYNKRFKNRHYNFQTGEVEEGSWYGTLNYIRQMVKEARNPANNKQFIKSFKESWQKADETTRRSLQRVALDLAVTNAMGLVALMLMNYADDDEDKDFVTQFGAYMAYRVTNEVATSSVAYPRQIFEFLESPIVGLDKIRQIGSVADVFSDSQVKAGDYRQFSESRAWMFKSLPIFKEYYRLSNMDRVRTTYEFHNKDNYNWIVPTTMMIEEEKE